jgi:bacilliredoxin
LGHSQVQLKSLKEDGMYPEEMVRPMREDLTRVGFHEMKTAAEVDAVLGATRGTVLVVVNSICGCAAGKARPGVALALRHPVRPEHLTTVFAGQDVDATERARSYFAEYPPSSPSVALLRDGKAVFMLHRHQIEGRMPEQIAADLTRAFDQFCAPARSAASL